MPSSPEAGGGKLAIAHRSFTRVSFVEVVVGTPATPEPLVVTLPSRERIEVTPGFVMADAAEFVRALRTC